MSVSQVQNDANHTETVTEQLAEANEKIARMSRDMDDLQIEQKLTHKLAAAGAVDLETAVLVAKARMEGEAQADIDGCVAQLRKEKAYLFGGSVEVTFSRKTAGAKDRVTSSQTALEQAAKKAARTGSRADLQHYLKLRRNLL
jgi:hypothetical protein